jgi:hypothetical protein
MLNRIMKTEPHMEHPSVAAERRATALDEINKMQQDLVLAHDEATSLKRELERAEDRLALVTEERDRHRRYAHIYRGKLIQLATAVANIGLLTNTAQEIMRSVNELVAKAETGEEAEAEKESAAEVVKKLPTFLQQQPMEAKPQ